MYYLCYLAKHKPSYKMSIYFQLKYKHIYNTCQEKNSTKLMNTKHCTLLHKPFNSCSESRHAMSTVVLLYQFGLHTGALTALSHKKLLVLLDQTNYPTL